MSGSERLVGFIGLGNMGSRMAANLLADGYKLAVFDIEQERAKRMGERGAKVCSSNRQVAEASEVIITILPTSREVREAVFGRNGLVWGLRKGQVLIEMSSIESEAIEDLSNQLEARGCHVIDAAVSGVEEHVERREILLIVAGEKAIIRSCKDILQALGKTVIHVGEIGAAKAMKTATATISAIHVMGAAEVMAWVTKRGLNPELLLKVARLSPAHVHNSTEVLQKIIKGRFKARASWAPKDVGFSLKDAEALKIPMPLAALTDQMFTAAKALGLGGYEVSGIACKVYEALAGVKIAKT